MIFVGVGFCWYGRCEQIHIDTPSACGILANRKKRKAEVMIDGYGSFFLLDKRGQPKVAMHIQQDIKRARENYNQKNVIPLLASRRTSTCKEVNMNQKILFVCHGNIC